MQTAIGDFPQSTTPVYPLYTTKGRNGLTASFLPLGAVLQKIAFLDNDGLEHSLALGFPTPESYASLACYAGAILGPNAGQIGRASCRERVCLYV